MCNFTSSRQVNGWPHQGPVVLAACNLCNSSTGRRCRNRDSNSGPPSAIILHSSNTKRLKARIASTSACQSCNTLPRAKGSFAWGRHFIPVLLAPDGAWLSRSSSIRFILGRLLTQVTDIVGRYPLEARLRCRSGAPIRGCHCLAPAAYA